MKRIYFLLLAMAIATSSAFAAKTTLTEKLSRGVNPVKENGVYVVKEEEPKENVLENGLTVPGAKKTNKATRVIREESSDVILYTLDSIVGKKESGEYTVKEEYEFDENGNSVASRMYYWDATENSWYKYKETINEWNDQNLCVSTANMSYSPYRVRGQKMTMVYNEAGQNIESVQYEYQDGEWVASNKYFYRYDDNGYMIEELAMLLGESGNWENYSKNVAAWTANGYRTLSEYYLWNGSEWVYGDSRMVYEYDEDGNLLTYLVQIPTSDNTLQNAKRILQEFNEYGLTLQTFELWNEENQNWFGSERLPSMYTTITYDQKGRTLKETGYQYNFEVQDWVEMNYIESVYTDLENGNTREVRSQVYVDGNVIKNQIVREYNFAGCDTYYKEYGIDDSTGQLVPYSERIKEYDEATGTKIINGENYVFEGETRYGSLKQSHIYDEAGYPVESTFWQGKYYSTGEGEPDEWVNYTHFEYLYERGQELKRMAYQWKDDEFVSNWGKQTDLDFEIPSSACLYWMNQSTDKDYQITAIRDYSSDGTGWTYEEGTWYYSKPEQSKVESVEAPRVRIYPNPATDFITVEAMDGSLVNIYSMQGALMISTQEHTIDVSSLLDGIYVVSVDGKATKLIKQ
ncbi:MAG: T9SS type A sorting domain-containing protein [Lepagella sp.]